MDIRFKRRNYESDRYSRLTTVGATRMIFSNFFINILERYFGSSNKSPPPFNITKIQISDKDQIAFASIKFVILETAPPEFELKVSAKVQHREPPQGILLTPCSSFYSNNLDKITANLLDISGNETYWKVKFDHDIFSGEPIKFVGKNHNRIQNNFNFGLQIANYCDLEIQYKIGEKWEIYQHKAEHLEQDPNKHRVNWATEIYEKRIFRTPLIKLHPKQETTINQIENILKGEDIGEVTYVGLDDAANFITSLTTLTNGGSRRPSKLNIRYDEQTDMLRQENYFKETGKCFSDNLVISEHEVGWPDRQELIIDTYTAMFWDNSNKGNNQVRGEIRTRIDSLEIDGYLVLTVPIEQEAFGVAQTPKLLKKYEALDSDFTERHGWKDAELVSHVKIGNSLSYTIKKLAPPKPSATWIHNVAHYNPHLSENPEEYERRPYGSRIDDEEEENILKGFNKLDEVKRQGLEDFWQKSEFNYNPEIIPDDRTIKWAEECCKKAPTAGLTSLSASPATLVKNWPEFAKACDVRGSLSFLRPIEIEEIGLIQNRLVQFLHPDAQGTMNIWCLQGDPGWGKTSMLGVALDNLWNSDNDEEKFINEKNFYVATLEEAEYHCRLGKEETKKSVIIIDDLHRYQIFTEKGEINHDEMTNRLKQISLSVYAVLSTSRIDEMGGFLAQDPKWGELLQFPAPITKETITNQSTKTGLTEREVFCHEIFNSQVMIYGLEGWIDNNENVDPTIIVNLIKERLFYDKDLPMNIREVREMLASYFTKLLENRRLKLDPPDFSQFMTPVTKAIDIFGVDEDE